MKLMWFGYLVYSLGNCATKLCIETDLRPCLVGKFFFCLATVALFVYI